MGNLDKNVNEADLINHFSTLGGVRSAKIIKDKTVSLHLYPWKLIEQTSVSQGFGFVEFYSAENAQAAIDTLNGTMFAGAEMKVTWSQSSAKAKEDPGGMYQATISTHPQNTSSLLATSAQKSTKQH